jgi:hypothetical protein
VRYSSLLLERGLKHYISDLVTNRSFTMYIARYYLALYGSLKMLGLDITTLLTFFVCLLGSVVESRPHNRKVQSSNPRVA